MLKADVPPIDPNTLPKDIDVLHKIVVDLCEQLRHESSEKDKYRSSGLLPRFLRIDSPLSSMR